MSDPSSRVFRGGEGSGASLVQRYIEKVWNAGDVALIDEIVSPSYVRDSPHNPDGIHGRDELRDFVTGIRQAFPDAAFSVEELLEANGGSRIVLRWMARGTHTGTFLGVRPTHQRVEVEGVCLYTIAGGQIAAVWAIWDVLGILEQLGVYPSLG